jgi:type IX secretion system PorP/SprF family membrane protein
MAKNYLSLLLVVIVSAFASVNAQDAPVLTFNIPSQNNIRNNRFLMNPSFSFVRENNTNVTLYHRSQWVQFDDSPKVYMLSFNGRFSDRAGFGVGVYQQNLGVISSFGGVGNYAYNIRLRERMNLTLGVNVAYYSSGVNKNRTITETQDPVLMAMRNNSLVSIKPGFNFSYRGFDIGAYAENLVEYDFKSNEMVEKYSEKKYSGHLIYTGAMGDRKDILEGGEFRVGLGGDYNDEGVKLNGMLLVDFPRIGWLQTSLHNYYGAGLGAGFHLTKRLSLGYTYERTLKEGLANLGPSHELTMVFKIGERATAELNNTPVDTTATALEDETDIADLLADEDEAVKPDFDKDVELEKLKMELDDDDLYLLEVLEKEDSLATVKKTDFDRKVKNLVEYAKREKEAKKLAAEKQELLNDILGTAPEDKKIGSDTIFAETAPKGENEIKEYYSKKTSKPRKKLQKVNKLTVDGMDSGYYIIANVFSTQENADKFIKQLRSKGFKDAGYFVNSANNFRYVYLKMHKSRSEALIAYYSNMNNTYFDTIWIGSINLK